MAKRRQNTREGVLKVEKVREILRLWSLGLKQREIHRATGIARSSIQEYLRTATVNSLTYEGIKGLSDEDLKTVLQKKTPGRNKKEAAAIDFMELHQELLIRKGTTLELLWQEWVEKTQGGLSYSTYCRRYHQWAKGQEVTLRHEYHFGEKGFSDFAGETLTYFENGNERKVEIFVCSLGASNAIYAEALPSQKIIHWIGAHCRAFEYFGGVTQALIIDNLKSGVTTACRYEPEITKAFQDWAEHYGTTVMPTRSGKPRDKGKVEKAVQDVERWVLAPLRHERFASIAEINVKIKERIAWVNNRSMKEYGASRSELLVKEQECLKPLPAQPFIVAQWKQVRVSLDYHISFDHHYYSVPYAYVRKEAWLRVTENLLEVFSGGVKIASHVRSHVPYRHSTIPSHMPEAHKAVRSWTVESFQSWGKTVGPETEKLVSVFLAAPRYKEQSFRSLLGVKRLHEKYGSTLMEEAARIANKAHIPSQRFIRKTIEKLAITRAEATSHQNIRGSDYYH